MSTFFTFFSASGHMGLFMTHGSMMTVLPPGVSMRKVACPNHVSLMPFKFMLPVAPDLAHAIQSVGSSEAPRLYERGEGFREQANASFARSFVAPERRLHSG